MSHVKLLTKNDARILFVADIRGHLSYFNVLAEKYNPDIIIHTGNFGFLDNESVSRIHESYLRHIVEFSPLLPKEIILKISELSKVSGDSVHHLSNDNLNLKTLLINQDISELPKFLSGELKLNIPVYTIYGMCEDSYVINRFRFNYYNIPNLHIIDDCNLHLIKFKNNSQSILLSGIGGSLSYHKLFHQGTTHNFNDILAKKDIPNNVIPISGDPGNIWITILQLGGFIKTILNYSEENPEEFNKSIKFFITHQSPTREPLLEHLSIFFKMDYTISNSLHFKYISSYNALTVNPSFETFKLKFADSRMKLAKIWSKVQKKYERLLIQLPNHQLALYTDLALSIYDKIPISTKSTVPNNINTPNKDVSITQSPQVQSQSQSQLQVQSQPQSQSPSQLQSQPTTLTTSDEIPSLSLSTSLLQTLNDNSESGYFEIHELLNKHEINLVIRHLNDLYYVAFQHSWHYNICDVGQGHLALNYNGSKVSMNAVSEGFDFSYRV